MKVTILGKNGFVGSHLEKYLKLNPKILLVEYSPENLSEVDTLIICVGTLGHSVLFENPEKVINSNYLYPMNILNQLRKSSFRGKILYLSSYFVYGECLRPKKEFHNCKPKGIYALYKYHAETLMREYSQHFGLRLSTLRICNLIGYDFDKFGLQHNSLHLILHKLVSNEILQLDYYGNQIRNIISINDLISIFDSLIQLDDVPNILNIGSSEEISIKDFSILAKELYGSTSQIILNPAQENYFGNPNAARINIKKLKSLGVISRTTDLSTMIAEWNTKLKLKH
jgi:nucleoside-diphosphate-sugar epimerase